MSEGKQEAKKKPAVIPIRLVLIVLFLVAGFLIYHSISTSTYKSRVQTLELELKAKDTAIKKLTAERNGLKDSINLYDSAAEKAGKDAAEFKVRAEQLRKERNAALAALRNLPVSAIDSFFVSRYSDVPKSDTVLKLDKNVGNEVVVELREKDFLQKELSGTQQENLSLSIQVSSLQNSLRVSKVTTGKADSIIVLKDSQLEMSKQINEALKQNIKTTKKRAFWAGLGIGVVFRTLLEVVVK